MCFYCIHIHFYDTNKIKVFITNACFTNAHEINIFIIQKYMFLKHINFYNTNTNAFITHTCFYYIIKYMFFCHIYMFL